MAVVPRTPEFGTYSGWRILKSTEIWGSVAEVPCTWCNVLSVVPSAKRDEMPSARPAAALPRCHRFNRVCGFDTRDVKHPLDRYHSITVSQVVCLGTQYHQLERRRDISAEETFSTFRRFWHKHHDAMEVLIMETDGRPDIHLALEKTAIPDDSVVGRSNRSLTAPEPQEERVTTEHASASREATAEEPLSLITGATC